MAVILAKNNGFCVGVKRAVDTANEIGGENVYILGEIIHNETVLNEIAKKGTKTVDFDSEVPDNSTCIIRSHGVGKAVLERLGNRNVKVINCTCPFVVKIHKIVEEYHSKGYLIVIIGKRDHPEVQGINGWCDNSAVIIDSEELPKTLLEAEKICVVSQTTYSVEKFNKILNRKK